MRNETILCLSTRIWDSLWRSTQQIMVRLAANNRVVFVEPQRNPDASYFSDFWQRWRYFGKVSVESSAPNLEVVHTPPGFPFFQRSLPSNFLRYLVPVVTRVNNWLMLWHLKRVVRKLGVQQPILWLYKTRDVGLAGHLGEKLVCYYCYDEHADFASNRRIRELLLDFDERLCRRADVVFTSSQLQYRRRRSFNHQTYFVPNGVDYPLFSRALNPATPVPPEIEGLSRPIVGFAGWLGHYIDVELLIALAETYPETSLILVGPDALKRDYLWRKLRSQSNVVFAGRKRRQELPGYLKEFDAALLPFILSGHILAAYPLKLHEYLAAGCSVVATGLPELEPFKSVVRIAKTREAFVRLLPEAVDDNGSDRVGERTRIARLNSWSRRTATINQILDARLAAKSHMLSENSGSQWNQSVRLDGPGRG